MRFLALACDFDATLAWEGQVAAETLEALQRVTASGRKLIMVTGRALGDLQGVFPHLELFHRVVAENGALLYNPQSREEKSLGQAPPPALLEALAKRSIPVAVGKTIVASDAAFDAAMLQAVRECRLEYQLVFNRGAAMLLPSGVNKASGLAAALAELKLSAHNVAGIGDAENDHAFLQMCECSIAVANALDSVKEHAHWVTSAANGAGVRQLIDQLLADDLLSLDERITRGKLAIGTDENENEVWFKPQGENLLICGTSGSGKSTIATAILERLSDAGYQFCIIDPEGDYEDFEHAVVAGNSKRPPGVEEALDLLEEPGENLVINLVGLPLADRPEFFAALLPRLQELRSRTARPHRIIVDETHHLLPASWNPAVISLPKILDGMIFITVHPDQVAPVALESVATVMVVGNAPHEILTWLTREIGQAPEAPEIPTLEKGEVLMWTRSAPFEAHPVRIAPSRTERSRHRRKYAEGELPPDRSFYFTGADGKLNLRAQNLILFLQIADGIDDDTWDFHLREKHYSKWFREAIKDDTLAEQAAQIEADNHHSAAESKQSIRALIQERYTLPA